MEPDPYRRPQKVDLEQSGPAPIPGPLCFQALELYREGLSLAEITVKLGLPVGSAQGAISWALRKGRTSDQRGNVGKDVMQMVDLASQSRVKP